MNAAKRKKIKKIQKKAKKGLLYKNRKYRVSAKNMYIINCANWEFHLMEEILMINKIPVGQYLYANDYGTICENFLINKKFKEMSCFNWEIVPYAKDSLAFRGKFSTLLLYWVMRHTDPLCKMIQSNIQGNKGELRGKALDNIIKRVDLFVINFMAGDTTYGDNMEDILDITTLEADDKKFHHIIKNFVNQKRFLIDIINCPEDDTPIGLIWDSILKLAYMMATNNTNFKNIPKYKEEIDLSDPHILKEYVGRLGLAILMFRANKHRKRPVLYTIWTKASPDYKSSFHEINEAVEFNIGVKALYYLMFLVDDENFTEYITEMI